MYSNRLIMSCLAFIVSFSPILAHSQINMLSTEQNSIDVFQLASPKVVYVERLVTVKKRTRSKQIQVISDGTGSGIIWDNAGHIVTNYHVIKGADHFQVTIGDVETDAKVVGAEPRKDIAVLKVYAPKVLAQLKTFKPFEIAPTRDLKVGQKSIAIGNPFGLDHTLTIGVVSAIHREFPGVGGVNIHGAIQTDASINPGNSGGPLLDSHGRLIGLNTAIFSQSGSSAGIGFAVPSDDVQSVVTQIITKGRVVLSGIGIQRAEPRTAEKLGVKEGILIEKVLPHTPAAKAKLATTTRDHWGRTHLGDVIVSINDHPVYNYDVFYNMLTKIGVGEEIKVTVVRDGKKINHQMKTIDIAAY
jgi:S1-C subfamily serine protease